MQRTQLFVSCSLAVFACCVIRVANSKTYLESEITSNPLLRSDQHIQNPTIATALVSHRPFLLQSRQLQLNNNNNNDTTSNFDNDNSDNNDNSTQSDGSKLKSPSAKRATRRIFQKSETDIQPESLRAFRAVQEAIQSDDRLKPLPQKASAEINQYIIDNIDDLRTPATSSQPLPDLNSIPEIVQQVGNHQDVAVFQFAASRGLVRLQGDDSGTGSEMGGPTMIRVNASSRTNDTVVKGRTRKISSKVSVAAKVRDQLDSQLQQQQYATSPHGDIGSSAQLLTATNSSLWAQTHALARSCMGVATGLELFDTHMAALTVGMAEELTDKLAEQTGIIRMLVAPVMMVLLTPLVEKLKQKMSSAGANPIIDMLADLVFLPLVLLLSIATVNIVGKILPDQLLDSLVLRLTSFLAALLEKDVGSAVSEDMVAFIALTLRKIANPLLATSVANFLISITPQALVDASATAVTEAVGTKTARMLQPQISSYLQCMYCYEKGMYCKQCWWNADLTWMQREWFLGGNPHVGALDFSEGSY